MEILGRASSAQVRRMFEDYCAAGLTPQETIAALRNDGFSSSDLAGLGEENLIGRGYSKTVARNVTQPVKNFRGTLPDAPRKSSAADTRRWNRNEGRATGNIPAALRSYREVWHCADEYPWRTLGLIALAAASLAALTVYKSARLVWRLAVRSKR